MGTLLDMAAQDRAKENIVKAALNGGASAISDDTMRWLFGTPDPALTGEQQFQKDFAAEKPDATANKKRRTFCAAHGLRAKQDKTNGYWTFTATAG